MSCLCASNVNVYSITEKNQIVSEQNPGWSLFAWLNFAFTSSKSVNPKTGPVKTG